MSDGVVAVLGLGEAGSRYAADLLAAGVTVVGHDPVARPDIPGLRQVDGPVAAVRDAAYVLSLNSASVAAAVAAAAAPGLRPGAVFADLNTGAPEVKRRVAETVESAGAAFVDVAVLAPVPRRGLRTPVALAGSGRAGLISFLAGFDVPVEDAGPRPGAAAARKLLRSVFMKGVAAVVLESLEIGALAGQQEWLREQIVAELTAADRAFVDRLVEGTPMHARRRLTEMRAVAGYAADLGADHDITRATIARLERLVADQPGADSPAAQSTRRQSARRSGGDDTLSDHPRPSPTARELVRGGYDPHVHIAPDVMKRRIDDLALARRFHEQGLGGFVLKSHYVPTAERASVVRAAVPGVDAVGAITLNASVGGLNPIAVEIAARGGARWVWLPTVDCRNQRESRAADPPGAKPPMWARLQQELRDEGIASPAIDVVDTDGEVTGALRDVLRVAAKHDLVIATGHLSRDEIFAVVDAATAAGVRRVVITHPEFTSQRISPADQRELAARGAYLERCFTTAHTGKCTWATVFEGVRAATPARSFFASDLGQPFNPPVEDGLALLADRFLAAGFTEEDVHTMAVTNTVALAGPTS